MADYTVESPTVKMAAVFGLDAKVHLANIKIVGMGHNALRKLVEWPFC